MVIDFRGVIDLGSGSLTETGSETPIAQNNVKDKFLLYF